MSSISIENAAQRAVSSNSYEVICGRALRIFFMKALVLAAGLGTRLKSIVHDRPKVMVQVGGKPFLEYLIEGLVKGGVSEIVIAIGYLGQFIREFAGDGSKFGIKIHYSYNDFPLGTGGAVALAEKQNFFTESYIVVNGDTYIDIDYEDLMQFHKDKGVPATIGIVKMQKKYAGGTLEIDRRGQVAGFKEKSDMGTARVSWVNAGVYVFSPGITKDGPGKKKFSLERDLFPRLARSGKLASYKLKEKFVDIGTPEGYFQAKKLLGKTSRRIVQAKAPTRISFAGGGTDLPIFFKSHGGIVVAGAINNYAYVRMESLNVPVARVFLRDFGRRQIYPLGKTLHYDGSVFDLYKALINRLKPEMGISVEAWADFPASSGLGSSSAFACAFILAVTKFQKKKSLKSEQLARLAIEIERDELNIPGGYQDQYMSAYGGIREITFTTNGKHTVRRMRIVTEKVKKLEKNLLLVYLGGRRREAVQQSYLTLAMQKNDKAKLALLKLKELTGEFKKILEKGRLDDFGRLLDLSWKLKKQSSAKISRGFIDKIYEQLILAGALGGKLLGAGGGGSMLVYVPEKFREKVVKKVHSLGLTMIPFSFVGMGAKAYL